MSAIGHYWNAGPWAPSGETVKDRFATAHGGAPRDLSRASFTASPLGASGLAFQQ